jgi:hypothetical protein
MVSIFKFWFSFNGNGYPVGGGLPKINSNHPKSNGGQGMQIDSDMSMRQLSDTIIHQPNIKPPIIINEIQNVGYGDKFNDDRVSSISQKVVETEVNHKTYFYHLVWDMSNL